METQRTVPVRLRAGHRERTLAITGLPRSTTLNRVIDQYGEEHFMPAAGLLLSSILAEVLQVSPGDDVTVEVLESARPVAQKPVAALVDDAMGLQAYMTIGELHRLMREGDLVGRVPAGGRGSSSRSGRAAQTRASHRGRGLDRGNACGCWVSRGGRCR